MFLCFQMVDESPTGILRETDLCPPFRKTLHHWIHTVVEATKRPKQQCRIPPDFGTVPLANIYESLSIRMAVSTSWPVNANKQTTAAAMLDIREKLAIPLSRARDSRFDISRSSGRRAFIYHLVDTLVNSFASQIPYECSWFVLTYEVQCSCWVSLFFFYGACSRRSWGRSPREWHCIAPFVFLSLTDIFVAWVVFAKFSLWFTSKWPLFEHCFCCF